MFGYSPRNAANAYSKVSMETGVIAADPHKLIMLLFDGAIMAIYNAIQQIEAGKIPEKGRSITHAISIVESGLRASLNKDVGGELAKNLDALYSYMAKQLFMANLKNDTKRLLEVKTLLNDLRGAWEQIAPVKAKQAEYVGTPKDALAPRKSSHIVV
ncbi:flagellar export chaperone FliS [Solimicrobium silvestre]|uniref:Flagellar secretion chaperone FliS n=1 Tax=Solimicrobium silvestre TaxID=2099400 RepID=A0A2S9GUV0_9BURK|nr:flagellar export chaperone FliS [Solimicrobium silvestre]PRC91490.1 fliS: flagellar protein FliS [Solimicrobium silvestre]